MNRYPARTLTLKAKKFLCDDLIHLTFKMSLAPEMGRSLLGEHVKLVIPNDSGFLSLPIENDAGEIEWPNGISHLKTYTVSSYNEELNEMSFDVCLHDNGEAGRFFRYIELHQCIGIFGPKVKIPLTLDFSKKRYLIGGDLSGVGTLRSFFKLMNQEATGDCLIVVSDRKNIFEFDSPRGFKIHWLISDQLCQSVESKIQDLIFDSKNLIETYFVGQTKEMNSLKTALTKYPFLNQDSLVARGYWKG